MKDMVSHNGKAVPLDEHLSALFREAAELLQREDIKASHALQAAAKCDQIARLAGDALRLGMTKTVGAYELAQAVQRSERTARAIRKILLTPDEDLK